MGFCKETSINVKVDCQTFDSEQEAACVGGLAIGTNFCLTAGGTDTVVTNTADTFTVATLDATVSGNLELDFGMSGAGGALTFDWGDGNTLVVNNGSVAISNDYGAGDQNVTISVSGPVCDAYTAQINALNFGNTPIEFTGVDISFDLADVLATFSPIGSNLAVRGNQGIVNGDLSEISPNMINFFIWGDGVITGDIASLPASLIRYSTRNNNTTTGDIANLPPSLINFETHGVNTVTGDIGTLPATLTTFNVLGNNTVSGDIANLPAGLNSLNVGGLNTITGDLANMPNVTFFVTTGANTIGGDIANIPGTVTFFTNSSTDTSAANLAITGDLANLNNSVVNFNSTGATDFTYTGKAWPANMQRVTLTENSAYANSGDGLSAAEVDQLLIDLAATTWTGTSTITITGVHAAPTAASAAAIATLTGLGVTVTTN